MNRKHILSLLAALAYSITVLGQMKWNQNYQNYINQYKDLAIEQMLKYRIPASITLAQGLFESGAGLSELAKKGNNHFGIKCHGWQGRAVYHDDDAKHECFRAYNSPGESFEDHSKFLSRQQRYSRLFNLKITDYKGWAHGLKACGYATNPTYATKLISIIELYKLYRYDKAHNYDKFMARHSSNNKAERNGGRLHTIMTYNKNYYLVAREGDTFKSIGKETEISWRKLAKYNERDKNDVLHAGDIVYLKKKRTKAEKTYKKRLHTVKQGESMYDIAQKYGIRLKSLYKMNHLSPDYQIRPGAQLRVY